jgi:hypothetical protein
VFRPRLESNQPLAPCRPQYLRVVCS